MTDELMRRVTIQPNGCWLWTGARTGDGYGLLSVNGRLILAHRLAFVLFNRPLTFDKCVLHRCDVPNCIAPDHLFAGTKQDNTDDMIAKGRDRFSRPKDHCKRGHPWSPENTRRDQQGYKVCRTCARIKHRDRRRRIAV